MPRSDSGRLAARGGLKGDPKGVIRASCRLYQFVTLTARSAVSSEICHTTLALAWTTVPRPALPDFRSLIPPGWCPPQLSRHREANGITLVTIPISSVRCPSEVFPSWLACRWRSVRFVRLELSIHGPERTLYATQRFDPEPHPLGPFIHGWAILIKLVFNIEQTREFVKHIIRFCRDRRETRRTRRTRKGLM